MEMKRWLVIDPAADEIRVLKAEPALRRGQAAFPLIVRVPDSEHRLFRDRPVEITMPGYTPPDVKAGPGEVVEEVTAEDGANRESPDDRGAG